METTNKTLEECLMQFQTEIGIIKKDSKNPHFKNTYASLTQILSEVKPVLTKCGLVLLQPIDVNGVTTKLLMVGGSETDFIESFIPLPVGLAPQPLGSAITYYRRYTLSSLLALEIDDDDATMASKPVEQKPTVSEIDLVNSKIINAKTLAELQTMFLALTPLEQRIANELKEKLKLTLK
jgi:hypothetical protein